jgi:hypothetical protein
MKNYARVKDSSYKRDTHSNAIICDDVSRLAALKLARQHRRTERERLEMCECRLANIEEMLQILINKL